MNPVSYTHLALSLVDSEKLNASLGALSVLFVELLGSMAIFEKIMNGAAIKGMGQLTIAMIGMSTAVLILAGAVQKLSGLDWNELLKGLVGVAGLSAIPVSYTHLDVYKRQVCDVKSRPPKKHSRREIMKRNAALNAARRKKWNTKG